MVDLCPFKSEICFELFAVTFLPLAILINFDRTLRKTFLGRPDEFFLPKYKRYFLYLAITVRYLLISLLISEIDFFCFLSKIVTAFSESS